MKDNGIQYFNRYTGKVETEVVYGERWLRFILFNPFGKIALHMVAKRAWFSRWYGWRMSRPSSAARVRPFIEQYGITKDENVKAADAFTSFNDFFYRKLKPEARPVDVATDSVVFPADGRHLGFAKASEVEEVFGFLVRYDLTGDVELAEHADASCVTLNVCLGPEDPGGSGRQGFQGGNLVFRGVRFQDEDASTRPQKAIEHKVGVAILHLGQHLHQAERITKGERENLIMWLTGKGGWVRVRPYSFINATGKWSETPFDEKLSLK